MSVLATKSATAALGLELCDPGKSELLELRV